MGVDLPGYGKSTSPGGFLAVQELADALLEWTRAREMDRPCLLGVSMGSQVVAEAAARAPDDVGSVVLAAPTTDPRGRAWPLLGARLIWNNMLEGVDVLSYSVPDYWDAGTSRVLRSWAQSREHRIEQVLPDVSQPALVVWGTQDKVCSKAWVEEATRLLPEVAWWSCRASTTRSAPPVPDSSRTRSRISSVSARRRHEATAGCRRVRFGDRYVECPFFLQRR